MKIIAGPWIGEFGWELMSWQGYLRKLAQEGNSIVVVSQPGHDFLYADFCKAYVGVGTNGKRDCWWTLPAPFVDTAWQKNKHRADSILAPSRSIKLEEQVFVKYGNKGAPQYDILFHARGLVGKLPFHAWPERNFIELTKLLKPYNLKIGAIGTEAFCPPGMDDLRKIPLRQLADYISSARLVVGPSSGPMHFASLCATKHIIWTDKQRYSSISGTNRERYETRWNPLKTPCTVIDEYGWNPPPLAVFKKIIERLGVTCPTS